MKDVQDNCGVFGLYSKDPCAWDIYHGIDFLQHRGQQYCGIATYDNGIRQVTHSGRVGVKFNLQELASLAGTFGIGHVSLWERQPITLYSKHGEIAVAFSGNIINADKLIAEMKQRGIAFHGNYHIEIIANIIMQEKDIVAGLSALSKKIEGAYSLVVLAKEGIYVTRDLYGFRPLVLGKDARRFAAASESRALHNLDMEIERDIRPGEIVLVDGKGFHSLKQLKSPRRAHCAFEWAYTASIDSILDGLYVQEARSNLGEALAQRDFDEKEPVADIVAPVPMSGIGHALGYHKKSGIPYQEVFLYNRYADRSYTQSTQKERELMAKRKLSVLRYAVAGKKVLICDDSIVRGTQIRDKVNELKNAGAAEVHVRIACPPLMYPCRFGVSTRSSEELIARHLLKKGDIKTMTQLKALESWIAAQINADSVKFNSIDAFVGALGLPRESLCLFCWDGRSPLQSVTRHAR